MTLLSTERSHCVGIIDSDTRLPSVSGVTFANAVPAMEFKARDLRLPLTYQSHRSLKCCHPSALAAKRFTECSCKIGKSRSKQGS